MNIKVQPKIHNRFDIYKKNVVTGEEKQVGYAENIVLDQMWARLCSGSTYFVNIHYGTGTGTLDPARTSLFTHLGTAAASDVETVRAYPTSHWRRSIVLGLTTANGSELTEVGIAYGATASNLVTHAQIRDMNGNVISILKTDVDIITIYATVYITMVNTDANIKLVAPDYNTLLSYLLGSSFPTARFYAGMSDLETDKPIGIMSYTIGTSPTGSWSNDVANKKRATSTVRFGTADANGHIKEFSLDNIARMVLPVSGIYSGLELSGVPVGIGDGETLKFALPSAYIDQSTLITKVDGVVASVTLNDKDIAYKKANFTGGNPTGTGNGCAFSPDGTILAVAHESSPYITMYEDIDGVWTKMPDVTGGYPAGNSYGVAFSPDGTILAVVHATSPYITMYEDIAGVWTKMPNVTGGYPTGIGRGCAFSPDGSILAVVHQTSPYITMYEDIAGVWTKMPNVTGGYPAGHGSNCAISPDGTMLAVAHVTSLYITMYEDIDGVWTKMPNVTGGYPTGTASGCSFSPDGTILAIAHSNLPCITMYAVDDIMTEVEFSTAPAVGSVITADYTVLGIHKTDQRVIDISGEIQFGEPTP